MRPRDCSGAVRPRAKTASPRHYPKAKPPINTSDFCCSLRQGDYATWVRERLQRSIPDIRHLEVEDTTELAWGFSDTAM